MPVLATLEDLPAIRAELRAASRIALDTEFHAERRYLPRLLLVQLHVEGGATWVVDPLVDGLLAGLADELLATPWLVHGGHQDMRLMLDALGGLPEVVLDTQIAAGLVRPDFPAAYVRLVEDLLDVQLDKSATLSDWTRRPLSPEQIRYAARDAELLGPLWDRLAAELQERGRLELAHAACREARDRVADPPADDLLWRDLNGLAHLAPAEAAIAQELVAWREGAAREANHPPRSVISDGLILDLSRRRPFSAERMLDNRRFPRSVAKKLGAELVDVIARAAGRPEWGWPRYVRAGTPEALALQWLCVHAEVIGRDDGFSPRLVLPRERLEDALLANGPLEERVDRALGSWRAAIAGAALADALRGRVHLHLDGGQVRTARRQDRILGSSPG